jgi:hypothetical protein
MILIFRIVRTPMIIEVTVPTRIIEMPKLLKARSKR